MSASKATRTRSSRGTAQPTSVLIALAAVFVFAVLLYVRPRLRLASVRPPRALHDPFHDAAHFVLADAYIGNDFLQSWTWDTLDDPTHGRVNYVDQPTALETNLTFASHDTFIMRAEAINTVLPSARGRNSVRIKSNKSYNESITILNLQHMPEGCATWPAFWSLSEQGPWPGGGEIDIIEGVNNNQQNLASLHTTPQCTMPEQSQRAMTGNVISTNCDTSVNFNQGCGVSFTQPASYGSAFNAAGGGYYVVVRTVERVRIWFWPRNDTSVPWEPAAEFPLQQQCDYKSHFNAHIFVFDLTFCGDWAGSAYSTSGCPGECVDYVDNNPTAFLNAYWEINSLYVYTPGTW